MANAVIINTDLHQVTQINSVDYAISKITDKNRFVKIDSILPFRVRFTTIGLEGWSSTNPPGIGLQVIGVNNWIL